MAYRFGNPISVVQNSGTSPTPTAQEMIANGQVGNTYRGLFSNWFNSKGIAKEDYMRNELSKQADFERSLEMLTKEQEFNASEAEKNRAFQMEMSNSSYQRLTEDLKKAGLSPLLAYYNGGASTPSGASASASGSYSSSGNSASKGGHADTGSLVSLIGSLISGSLLAGSRLASTSMLIASKK